MEMTIEQKREEYLRLQGEWAKEAKVKKGDSVVVMTKADSGQGDWQDEWVEGMDEIVGKEGEVLEFSVSGIIVGFADRVCALPFFVLVKA